MYIAVMTVLSDATQLTSVHLPMFYLFFSYSILYGEGQYY